MAKPCLHDLNYGHFGQATYNTDRREWLFSRIPDRQKSSLRQVGPWKEALPRPTPFQDGSASEPRTLRRATQQYHSLATAFPELAAASDILPTSTVTSSAVTSIASLHDPAVGSLLALGRCTNEERRRNIYIAAVPAGHAGEVLRLAIVARERHGWDTNKTIFVESPAITAEGSGYWTGAGAAPIQQICFSQANVQSPYLAVRLLTKTVIFRPIYHNRPQPGCRSAFYQCPASSIDPHPNVEISVDQTGGYAHADVTFNPGYQRQAGIVDCMGNWSVWEMEGRQRNYTASCTHKGIVTNGSPERKTDREMNDAQSLEDGWARITWVGDVNTLLVCNRRVLNVFSLKDEAAGPILLPTPKLLSSLRSADWILDAQLAPRKSTQVFVLTTERLYLMAVAVPDDVIGRVDDEEESVHPVVSVVLSWWHYRSPEDISLHMSVALGAKDETFIFLYSRLNNLVTVIRLSEHDTQPPLAFSSPDPAELCLDDTIFSLHSHRQHIIGFHVEESPYGEYQRVEGTSLGEDYFYSGTQFYRLCIILSDFSVHETLLYLQGSQDAEGGGVQVAAQFIEAPTWHKTMRPMHHASSAIIGGSDGFVIPDGLQENVRFCMSGLHRNPRQFIAWEMNPAHSRQLLENPRDIDFAFLYCVLCKPVSDRKDQNAADVVSIIQSVQDLLLEDSDPITVTQGTLLDLATTHLHVMDIDAASFKLSELSNVHESAPALLEVRRIAPDHVLQLTSLGDHETSISTVYDDILQTFIAPLHQTVPARVRQAKEVIARCIAAEIMLASTSLRRVDSLAAQRPVTPTPQSAPGQHNAVALPILPSQNPKQETYFQSSSPTLVYSQMSSQGLPTPESTPSVASIGTADLADPMKRLGRYLTITNESPVIGVNTQKVLQHWRVCEDPADYSWELMTEELGETFEDQEQLAAQKEKRKRRAEKRAKRQKREDELLGNQPIFGNQPALRSSPGPVVGGSQNASQSQKQTFPFVASQVEPGRHGGRPVVKKKKRMGGF